MKIWRYLSDTHVDPDLGGQYSLLNLASATCSYPQVHDFHEVTLTVQGHQVISLGGRSIPLESGDLIWVRPDEVHDKSGFRDCTQLNLSFTQGTVDSMLAYFDDDRTTALVRSGEAMPVLHLTAAQQADIRKALDRLNFLSSRDISRARVRMRILLCQVLGYYAQYVRDTAGTVQDQPLPQWLSLLLWELESPDRLSSTLDDLAEMSKKNKAYLSRSFRKYLDATPTQYLNRLRLEYAENLLSHTDKSIVEVSSESGFDNLSHFYHQFQKKNGVSPKAWRRGTVAFSH